MINFALMKSGSSKLVYVGHSMGTTALFIMMNLHPEMESRIYSAHLLAPGNNITMEHENNNAISELIPMVITNYFHYEPCSNSNFTITNCRNRERVGKKTKNTYEKHVFSYEKGVK